MTRNENSGNEGMFGTVGSTTTRTIYQDTPEESIMEYRVRTQHGMEINQKF